MVGGHAPPTQGTVFWVEQLGWNEEPHAWHSVLCTLHGSLGLSGVGSDAFSRAEDQVTDPSEVGDMWRREAGQDLPGIVVQHPSTCPTVVLQRGGTHLSTNLVPKNHGANVADGR